MSTTADTGANLLLGTWQLVRWDIAYGDARKPSLPFGAQATGMIMYTTDGQMNACIARGERRPLSSESARSAPEAERLAAFESYFQYAGPYAIRTQGGRQQVVHTVTHALNPNLVGTQQIRNMDFSDDRQQLTLSASDTVPGTDIARHHRLVWSRRAPQ